MWRFVFGDALVLARPDSPGLLALNQTAALLWDEFVSHGDTSRAAHLLAERFDLPRMEAERDVEETFSTFRQFISASTRNPDHQAPLSVGQVAFSAAYQVNDTAFSLHLATEALAQEIAPRLASLRISDVAPVHTFTLCEEITGVSLYRDGVWFAREELITGARALLLQESTRLCVPGREFSAILHAGACGDSRRCVILAGASLSGKSTFCAGMMSAGYECYSDDSACLTLDFQVAGMPFALALREGDRFRPSNLQGKSPTLPPAALVFVDYQPGSATLFEPITSLEAFGELQRAGFWVAHTQPGIAAFLHWLEAIPAYRMRYSQLLEAMPRVTALLATS